MYRLHDGDTVTELEGVFHSNSKEFWDCPWWLLFKGEGEILMFGVDFDPPLDVQVDPGYYEYSAEVKLLWIVSHLEAFYQGSKLHTVIKRKN